MNEDYDSIKYDDAYFMMKLSLWSFSLHIIVFCMHINDCRMCNKVYRHTYLHILNCIFIVYFSFIFYNLVYFTISLYQNLRLHYMMYFLKTNRFVYICQSSHIVFTSKQDDFIHVHDRLHQKRKHSNF